MTTVGNIESLQRKIEQRIASAIDNKVNIRTRDIGWKKAMNGSRIAFDMSCDKFPSTAQRKRGVRCPVFPLRSGFDLLEAQIWASWHEEWHCEKRGAFDLVGVGWTFFWGFDGRLGQETEIIRAEWDHVKHRGGFAAQPHWHLDSALMVGYTRPRPTPLPKREMSDLVELPQPEYSGRLIEIGESLEIQEVDVSGMHLGMGGWEHDDSHPRCWQFALTAELNELVLWAERTLQSARDQFMELKVTQIAN
jgi:hypothetical protein